MALSGSPMAPPGTDESKLPPPDRRADGIGVFDVKQGKLLRVIHGGSDPEQTAVTQDGRWLFVANEDAGQASVIEISDGRVVGTRSGRRRAGRCRSASGRQGRVRHV